MYHRKETSRRQCVAAVCRNSRCVLSGCPNVISIAVRGALSCTEVSLNQLALVQQQSVVTELFGKAGRNPSLSHCVWGLHSLGYFVYVSVHLGLLQGMILCDVNDAVFGLL